MRSLFFYTNIKKAKKLGFKTLAICNVLGSTLTRVCDGTFFTHCGPEISVASTKAFTSQVTVMAMLALRLAELKGTLTAELATDPIFTENYIEYMMF